MIPEGFGLGSSTVWRRFIRASTGKRRERVERRLDELDIGGIIIDGKAFKDDEVVIALGVTVEGKKVTLGFQSGTENAAVCRDFLNSLLERGLG